MDHGCSINSQILSPRTHLYHAYKKYMEAHGHKNLLNLTRFGAQLPETLKEAGIKLQKVRTRVGYQYNVVLTDEANIWLDEEVIDNENLSVLN